MITDGEGNDYSALEHFEFTRPRGWIQFADGSWEPVWADGSVGDTAVTYPHQGSNLGPAA